MLTAAATLAFAVSLAAIAFAGGATVTVGSASNAQLGEQLLVSSQGRTLYVLSPETTRHLLCKSSECLKFWPPLTVRSSTTRLEEGAGVHGHLGILRRSNGILQVTLNGRPLYRFAEDHANGEVNGQDFKSFGGTWHVLSVSGSPSSTMPPGASAPTSSAPSYPPASPTPPTSTPPASPTPTTSTPTSTNPSPPGWEY
jgi:predicted lipoprotein with Yx(FWY)xxD motif